MDGVDLEVEVVDLAVVAVGLLAEGFVTVDLGVAVVVLMTMVCFGFPQDRDIFLSVNKKLFKRLLLYRTCSYDVYGQEVTRNEKSRKNVVLRLNPSIILRMEIQRFTGGMVMTNSYLLDGKVLVDAPEGVCQWLKDLGETPTTLLLTHQHYDHVESVAELQAAGVKVYAYAPYSKELTLENFLALQGRPMTVQPYEIDEELAGTMADGVGELSVEGLDFALMHIPGHSPDSVAFQYNDQVFAGDTLFAGGIGRPDLPGGDQKLLLDGIQKHLLVQAPETVVFPGHGPETSVGRELAFHGITG